MVSEDVACGVGGAWRMSMRCAATVGALQSMET